MSNQTDNARAKKRPATGNIGSALKHISDVRMIDTVSTADSQFIDLVGRRNHIERAIDMLNAELDHMDYCEQDQHADS